MNGAGTQELCLLIMHILYLQMPVSLGPRAIIYQVLLQMQWNCNHHHNSYNVSVPACVCACVWVHACV